MNKEDLHVGMKVKVFDVNARTHGQPGGGWDGVVTEVRRTQCSIEYLGATESFEIDSQRKAGDRSSHRSFKSLEQVEASERRRQALERLKPFEIYPSAMRNVSTEKLQAIADILEKP